MGNIALKRFSLVSILVIFFILLYPHPSFAYEKEIKSLSSAMAENIAKAGKKTVAVVDFTDLQGNTTELGRFIAEELSVDLTIVAKDFKIIDRTHLKTILAEHKLSISGLIDPKTVKKLGEIAGVDVIVTGSVTPFGDSIRVSSKIIATDTARVIGAAKGDIPKTKAIEELLAREIGTIPNQPTPTTPKPPAKAQQVVAVKDFVFELQSCKLGGGVVTCSLLVTNKQKRDREVTLGKACYYSPEARMFDNFGNEYCTSNIQLGNKIGSYPTHLLISDIPVRAGLTLEKVSPEATMISLLEFIVESEGESVVQFRNIPLSR